jgi:hypothetical protein
MGFIQPLNLDVTLRPPPSDSLVPPGGVVRVLPVIMIGVSTMRSFVADQLMI